MKNVLISLAMTVLLAACASGPRVNVASNTNPSTDFASFETYDFMQPLGTDRAGGVRTPLSEMLSTALSAEMEKRGFRRASEPDILINVFVNTEQRLDVRQVPTSSSFHGYRRGRYSTWGSYRTEVREYNQGTLAVDLVDAGQNILAWEGVAMQRLGRNTEINQEAVDQVVAAVMAEFEHSAK
ncbi:MAG: DUF4136 domain-containing protein [Halieaceae bacterium]